MEPLTRTTKADRLAQLADTLEQTILGRVEAADSAAVVVNESQQQHDEAEGPKQQIHQRIYNLERIITAVQKMMDDSTSESSLNNNNKTTEVDFNNTKLTNNLIYKSTTNKTVFI